MCSAQCIKIGYSSAQCIKIGYSSAQCNKIGYSSAQCINIRYNSAQCNKIGYSSAQYIKIGYSSVQCIKIGYSSVQCIKIWNRVFSALCDNFRIVFSNFSGTCARPGELFRGRIVFTPPRDNFSTACRPLSLPYNFSP